MALRRSTILLSKIPKGEASKIAATTTTGGEPGVDTTMMPWNGWFTTLLKDKLGDDKFQKVS